MEKFQKEEEESIALPPACRAGSKKHAITPEFENVAKVKAEGRTVEDHEVPLFLSENVFQSIATKKFS